MSADWLESRGRRFDPAHDRLPRGPMFSAATRSGEGVFADQDGELAAKSPERARLDDAIGRTRDYLFSVQQDRKSVV